MNRCQRVRRQRAFRSIRARRHRYSLEDWTRAVRQIIVQRRSSRLSLSCSASNSLAIDYAIVFSPRLRLHGVEYLICLNRWRKYRAEFAPIASDLHITATLPAWVLLFSQAGSLGYVSFHYEWLDNTEDNVNDPQSWFQGETRTMETRTYSSTGFQRQL